jgi:hypothetical protein
MASLSFASLSLAISGQNLIENVIERIHQLYIPCHSPPLLKDTRFQMDETSDTAVNSSPVQPRIASSAPSHKAKGSTLLLKVTQQEEKIQSLSQDLEAAVVLSLEHKQLIQALQNDMKKVSKDLEKAYARIKAVDEEYAELVKVVAELVEKDRQIVNADENSSDEGIDEGLTAAERERIEASISAYSDPTFKVRRYRCFIIKIH